MDSLRGENALWGLILNMFSSEPESNILCVFMRDKRVLCDEVCFLGRDVPLAHQLTHLEKADKL